MSLFFGKHENRLDVKGRVSIPAPFRAILKSEPGAIPLVLCPSHIKGCIEAWAPSAYAEMARTELSKYDRLDAAYDETVSRLFTDAWQLETDKEGRIALPSGALTLTGIKDAVAFFGRGDNFHIWEPAAGAAHLAAARAAVAGARAAVAGVRA